MNKGVVVGIVIDQYGKRASNACAVLYGIEGGSNYIPINKMVDVRSNGTFQIQFEWGGYDIDEMMHQQDSNGNIVVPLKMGAFTMIPDRNDMYRGHPKAILSMDLAGVVGLNFSGGADDWAKLAGDLNKLLKDSPLYKRYASMMGTGMLSTENKALFCKAVLDMGGYGAAW